MRKYDRRAKTSQRRPWITETPASEVEAALAELRKLSVQLTTLYSFENNGFHVLRYDADGGVYPPQIAQGRLIVATKDYARFASIVAALYRERRGEAQRKPAGISTSVQKVRKTS